jgi:hypothetical protein
MFLKVFRVVTRRHFFVYDQRFGITLKMGRTSDPETLVKHRKMTPVNNPEDFKQQGWGVFILYT